MGNFWRAPRFQVAAFFRLLENAPAETTRTDPLQIDSLRIVVVELRMAKT
jgi:hypothetical protein